MLNCSFFGVSNEESESEDSLDDEDIYEIGAEFDEEIVIFDYT